MFSLSTPGQFQINVPQHAQIAEVAEVLAKEGCGLVRLPWNWYNANIQGRDILATVKTFIDRGIRVVLDYHPDGREQSRLTLWELVKAWEYLAELFKDIPTDKGAFHILNEPNADICKEFYEREVQKACSAVWKITPDRLCIVSNHMMGNPDGWIQRPGGKPEIRFKMPVGGPVAAAMSYYRPYDVVKAGSDRAYPPVKEGLLKDFPFDDYKNQELHFKVFRDYCDKHKIQPWLSETGCHRDVPGRLHYAKDIKALGEKYNIPICWWAFRDEYGANPRYYDPKRGIVLERDHYYWETITA